MGNRYIATIVLACLGILSIITLQGSPRIAQVLTPMDSTQNPVGAVQGFYAAIERGDWFRVRALTTGQCYQDLNDKGLLRVWQEAIKKDKSQKFSGFAVQDSLLEGDKAIIEGRAQWESALGTIPRTTQIITLEEGLGGWRISSIKEKTSVTVVENFYAYLAQKQWDNAKKLISPETWRGLETKGTTARLKAGNAPLVKAKVLEVNEASNLSQVKVELIWQSPQKFTAQAVVKLSITGENWTIRQIDGGWPK
ncbi:MAG TPA: hypothetical protein VNU93_02110 [Verrucomicrobiae bacterium]|nr:hypothetical protein [Verrucomicrobiae bacterium]